MIHHFAEFVIQHGGPFAYFTLQQCVQLLPHSHAALTTCALAIRRWAQKDAATFAAARKKSWR